MQTLLEVKNLSKSFKGKCFLKDVSFSVREGEIVGLLGANGAGKSTCMKMIAGLYTKTSGEIILLQHSPFSEWHQIFNHVGILLEQTIPNYITGHEFLKQVSILKGKASENLDDLLSMCGLLEAKSVKVRNYSFGMKQRLGLAAALMGKPKFLMLDEPFVGLDPLGIKELQQILQDLASTGTAVFISSHQLAELEYLVDRVLFLKNGQLQQETCDTNIAILRGMFEEERKICVN